MFWQDKIKKQKSYYGDCCGKESLVSPRLHQSIHPTAYGSASLLRQNMFCVGPFWKKKKRNNAFRKHRSEIPCSYFWWCYPMGEKHMVHRSTSCSVMASFPISLDEKKMIVTPHVQVYKDKRQLDACTHPVHVISAASELSLSERKNFWTPNTLDEILELPPGKIKCLVVDALGCVGDKQSSSKQLQKAWETC